MKLRLLRQVTYLIFFIFLFFPSHFTFGQITYEDAFPNVSFNFPVELQTANDGSDRIFVVEQTGIIKVFPNSSSISSSEVSTFLDIQSQVSYSAGQEIGLLGLAFHPNYSSNGLFYVYYIDQPSNYRVNIVRYQVDSGNSNAADLSSETIIFRTEKNQNNSNHNGGKIGFGPDGYLYASIGDGGGGSDPQGNGQNLNTAFGSILRIDVDLDGNNPVETNPDAPDGNYEIPSDNPRVGQSGLDELYAWGIRNTWKFSFDNDLLYGADVGQDSVEEINIIENGGNYGWNRFEGNDFEVSSTSLVTSPDIKPIFTYGRSSGDLSITGGYVYRGSITDNSIQQKYIYGDYVSGRVWALDYNESTGSASSEFLFRTNGQFISSFGLDESGELLFSDYGSNVKIYKIVEDLPDPETIAVDGVGAWINKGVPGVNGIVQTIANDGSDTFYVGGEFTSVSGTGATNLAIYEKSTGWRAFGNGTNGEVSAIAVDSDDNVYIGGAFTQVDGVSANNIAVWNGTTWSALTSGTSGPVSKIGIDSNNNVYVGGSFDTAGGVTANNIALWQSGSWSALTDASNAIAGTNNEIRAIAFDESDNLYVGGNFDSAGGNSAPRIAVWNGTNWGTLGLGTSGFVQAIVVRPDYIYAGGNFAIAGNETVNRIAKWDRNTSTWESLNNGLSGNVNSLVHDGTYLYAGGSFETASDVTNINEIMNNIARWSDTDGWEALGTSTNVGVETAVNALSFSQDNSELCVGGNFDSAGAITAENIAIWGGSISCDDSSITPEYQVDGNLQSGVNSLAVVEGSTFVLGITQDLYFSIELLDGSVVTGDYDFGVLELNDTGTYTIITTEGCSETFELTVILDPNGDEDGDGVINSSDTCPGTPSGETVDGNGCGPSQLDDDNDGISNVNDICPNTPNGETVNSNGCGDSQLDDDNDGVSNADDICPNTPAGEAVDTSGCAESQRDDDNDGVLNPDDSCPGTPAGETVDSNGCGPSQLDDDNDGVSNADDICPNTPTGEAVDTSGCAESQRDDDNDGVLNPDDSCPGTPAGEIVDSNGCGPSQLDDDNDGVSNADDICPNTPTGETADVLGCGPSQQDIDNDGVSNADDLCNDTLPGETVDANGCSESQLDDDNDGVSNALDKCPNTPDGALVDNDGCVLSALPTDNFRIASISTTCRGIFDGQLLIGADLVFQYTATLTGTSFSEVNNFTDNLIVDSLPAGSYELCITVAEFPDYESCSTVVVDTPQPLSVFSSLDNSSGAVTLKMQGSHEYFVTLNDATFKTSSNEITLNLDKKSNHIKVTTGQDCQGTYEETIFLANSALVRPNPFTNYFILNIERFKGNALQLSIYDISGRLIRRKGIAVTTDAEIKIAADTLRPGVYLAILESEESKQTFKLVKQ